MVNGIEVFGGQGDSGCTVYRVSDYALAGVFSGHIVYTTYNGTSYGKEVFVTPAWVAQQHLGSTFYQYTNTTVTPVSSMQGS